ncbi:MAG: ATP synthase F1 subunit delta [Eubacteriaceae bacterium]|nr:ATP synthase F1 subunit delta [Eubacteriaceae bacterium]
MAELTVETAYATALFDAANDIGKENIILSEITQIKKLLIQNGEFLEFLKTPVIEQEDKKQALRDIFTGRISKETLNFLYILIDKRRMSKFIKIADMYTALLNESRNISPGTIYSAVDLTYEQIKDFDEKVSNLIGKKAELKNIKDPSIIGGVKIFVEGKVIDATIKKRLTDLEESLRI